MNLCEKARKTVEQIQLGFSKQEKDFELKKDDEILHHVHVVCYY